jgi:ABC-2 type transport system ATP-binding protein
MDTVISVTRLRRSYGDVPAVRDVSFTVSRGEIFGILGPNGAGKTTIVESVQGLRPRDGGEIEVLGIDPARAADRLRGRIGSQLQSAALPDRMRVGEAVGFFAALQRRPVDVARTLEEWDLARLRRRAFGTLSGGQRQRLFLALALLGEPEVVFLDELTAALDPSARRATWELVRRVRDRGATIVLVTHFMEEAEALCDRVAIVDDGRVVALGTPAALSAGSGGDVEVRFSTNGRDLAFLHRLPGVTSVTLDAGEAAITGEATVPVRVAAALAEQGIVPGDYRTHHPTLEDVFLSLTGRSLIREVSA